MVSNAHRLVFGSGMEIFFLNINLVKKYVQLWHKTQGCLILAVDFRMRDAP